jgi:cell division inhibitor SepF
MSALRKAGVWLGLIEDDDDRAYGYDERTYDEDYPDDEVEDSSSMVRARVADRLAEQRAERERISAERAAAERAALERAAERAERGRDSDTVRPITRPTGAAPSYATRENLALAPEPPQVSIVPRPVHRPIEEERRYQITTLHPTTFSEARTIGEHFRDGVPVILNLTDISEADAKRLVDFAAGLAFGLRGTMERVTNRVFLLSPANVTVTAEDKAKIAEGGFFYPS